MSFLKNFMQKKNKLITHNGSFHADDIFSSAALFLMLEKRGENAEIIRTRDEEIIRAGDYVFDVGGIYDEKTNRFDHHMAGGAGKRENGIEYSSFGLIWKKFGVEISGGQKIFEIIDKKLVSPIDAGDNGIDLVENKYDASPYYIQSFFDIMRPSWIEKTENKEITEDKMFLKCVDIAKEILKREIIQAYASVSSFEQVLSIYKNTEDKRIIILDKDYPYEEALNSFSEPLYVIYERTSDNLWGVRAVRKDPKTFENRKDFPFSWGGLRDVELQKITGVSDAVFCHRALFLAVAKSKEGAIQLAKKALAS